MSEFRTKYMVPHSLCPTRDFIFVCMQIVDAETVSAAPTITALL